jgi:CO/xanthine dehydrogenase FAD-binding subunit
MPANILLPTTPEDAVASFGDGGDVTVFGGGTILVPELTMRDTSDLRVLFLARAGLDGITRTNGTVTIGAGTPIAALEELDEPLATASRHVADPEIRAQATVGGNLCARATSEAPRGDLQAPLIALDATVRSASSGSEYVEPIEEFLASNQPRLVLDVSYPDTSRLTGYAAASRPHAHHYTILAACAAQTNDTTRVAVTGAGAKGLRCAAVEQAIAEGGAAAEAAARALDDAGDELRDDALASAWYRRQVLPVIVERALAQLEGTTT